MARLSKAGKLLHDVSVRYQVYLERLKAGEVRKVDPILRSLDRLVRQALAAAPAQPTPAQVNRLLRQLRREAEKVLVKYQANSVGELKRLSAYATQFHEETLALVWPVGAPALAAPAASAAWAATLAQPVQATGQLLEPFIENWGRRTLDRVEGAIRTGYSQGLTTDEIIRSVRGTKAANFADGVLGGVARRDAAAVVNTSLQQVSNQAQMAVYASNAAMIEGYQFVATLDSKTTDQCMALDGQQFKVGEGPVPPLHVNCRSITIPVVKGVDLTEGRTRASSGDAGGQQVDGKLSYFDWLKQQPASFQDDALGPARASLFRNGGLSADEFARLSLGKNFQPLTLDQMRRKNPAAFERAGI